MITVEPIGVVRSPRIAVDDDNWGAVEARIEVAPSLPAESLDGLEAFSHVEVIYHFDRVPEESIVSGARHPRSNPLWPRVGIFAQRGKDRPNRVGSTMVEIVRRDGRTLHVRGLDAIDGTPVLDLKPVMREFLPRTPVVQPDWATQLMSGYWQPD